MPFNIIYLTFPNQASAEELTDRLLQERLVAGVNIFPIKSAYWWQGAIQKEGEFVAIVQTQSALWDAVRDFVEKHHPYDTPCVMRLQAEANTAYEEWINEMTQLSHV